jgi:hypothetical protein
MAWTIVVVIIIIIIIIIKSVQRIGIELDDPVFESRQEHEIFLVCNTCRTSLGPTQPSIRYLLAFFPVGKAAGS